MFNKKLMAAGILAVASTSATAAPTFGFTAATYADAGSASTDIFTSPAITIQMGAEYAADDLMTLSFNADFDDGFNLPSTLSFYAPCAAQDAGGAGGTAAENGGTITAGLLTNDASSVTYRITTIDYTETSAGGGAVCDGQAVASSTVEAIATFTPDFQGTTVIAAGTVTGTYSASLPNGITAIDGGVKDIATGGAGTNKLISFVDQYAVDATFDDDFDGTIDVTVTPARSEFDDGDTDILKVGIVETAGNVSESSADAEVVTLTITGDWSFIVDEDTTTEGIQSDSMVCTMGAGADAMTESYTATAITAVGAAGDVDDITCTFDNDDNGDSKQVIPAGSYSTSVSIAYEDAGVDGDNGALADEVDGTEVLATAAGGTWDLNGSTSTIQALPLGDAITRFVWVTNAGASSYGMSATAVGDGSTMAECSLGDVAAKSLVYVSNELDTCLDDAGLDSARAQVTITVNAPSSEIDVYAGYKVDADDDRLSLTVD